MAVAGDRSAKRTYSLDGTTVERFESLIPAGQRSAIVEELMTKRVEELERERLRALIHEGLAYMADVYAETEKEWAGVEVEGWPAE